MSSGAIDYTRLLQQDLQQIDFYGTREHLATLPGHALAHQVLVRAGALAANGLRRGDRIVMVSANTEQYLATLLAALLIGALPCAVAPPPTPSDEKSAGSSICVPRSASSIPSWWWRNPALRSRCRTRACSYMTNSKRPNPFRCRSATRPSRVTSIMSSSRRVRRPRPRRCC
ncbi:AMP-binding enzyme family protein [Mycobacterium kansasii]|uniref:AMP-binding enzyme family protein n=1 Tax=Mycobacterium kansasii TaxID=1768 RepID=A0A1V3XBK8_MYCKA|nr:AMP-binding enzyme family protein [Mycobacterium kansasii]